jgi:hypothetical protein
MKKIIILALCAVTLGVNAQKKATTKALPPVSDKMMENAVTVSYTHHRAHETG